MKSLGIIAGNRNFPILAACSAREKGVEHIFAVGFRGITIPDLKRYVDCLEWIGVGQLGRLREFFRSKGVEQMMMVGQIPHRLTLRALKFDQEGLEFFREIKEKNARTILGALIQKIEKQGFKFFDSTQFLTDQLVPEGVLTHRKPSDQQVEDLKYGWRVAKALADLEAGQTVVVKNGVLVALEGIEGTDRAILRGGRLAGRGSVVVKVARSHQDMRYDVPVVGMDTLKALRKAKCVVLGVESGKTLILDKDEFSKKAESLQISVVGMNSKEFVL